MMDKFNFGDKVTWHDRGFGILRKSEYVRAIFDFTNKDGDAAILVHPEDCGRTPYDGHKDVPFSKIKKGWDSE